MYKKIIFSLLLVPVLGFAQKPENTPVPYTLADRDRLNRVEIRLEALEDKVDILRGDMNTLRVEMREDMNTLRTEIREDMNALSIALRTEMDAKFTSLLQIFLWGFGLLLASIMGLVGFMVWDRRSFMVKIEKRVTVLEQKKRMQPV